jgi:rhodanese-related sulfurtransferase
MAYTKKFQQLANEACSRVEGIMATAVDALIAAGAVALDIRDSEEHVADHIEG